MKEICTTHLTGVKMGKLKQHVHGIKPDTVLSIHRRPDNTYDSQAMSVHFGPDVTSPQIGWIPNKEYEDKIIKTVLNNLSKYHPLEAVVKSVDSEVHHVEVIVCLKEPVAPDYPGDARPGKYAGSGYEAEDLCDADD